MQGTSEALWTIVASCIVPNRRKEERNNVGGMEWQINFTYSVSCSYDISLWLDFYFHFIFIVTLPYFVVNILYLKFCFVSSQSLLLFPLTLILFLFSLVENLLSFNLLFVHSLQFFTLSLLLFCLLVNHFQGNLFPCSHTTLVINFWPNYCPTFPTSLASSYSQKIEAAGFSSMFLHPYPENRTS